jgi:hypothetical protein
VAFDGRFGCYGRELWRLRVRRIETFYGLGLALGGGSRASCLMIDDDGRLGSEGWMGMGRCFSLLFLLERAERFCILYGLHDVMF